MRLESGSGRTRIITNDMVCLGYDLNDRFERSRFIKSIAIRLSKLAYKVSDMAFVHSIKADVDCVNKVVNFEVVGYYVLPIYMAKIVVVKGKCRFKKIGKYRHDVEYDVKVHNKGIVSMNMIKLGKLGLVLQNQNEEIK